MRNLLLFVMALFAATSSFAQSPCSHTASWINTSNGSTPGITLTYTASGTATGSQKKTAIAYWGDGNWNILSNLGGTIYHQYTGFGTFNLKVEVKIIDTANSTLVCADSTVQTFQLTTNPCAATYTYVHDPLNNGKVTFNVVSPQSGMTYTWTFDDGSPAATGATTTHTFAKYGRYKVRLTSSNGSTCSNTYTPAFYIYPVNGCNGISNAMTVQVTGSWVANFYANAPYMGSGKWLFYEWDFGDGNSTNSSQSNHYVSHTYTLNGNYNVQQIVKVVDSATNTTMCSDTTVKPIQIGPFNIISGYIFRDTTIAPVSADTKVWLIQFDSVANTLTAVDSQTVTSINAQTSVYFQNKAHGKYMMKAAITNNPTTGTVNVPTYSDSSLLWSGGKKINHNANSSYHIIHMRKGAPTSGPGFVGGNVSQGANKGTASGIAGLNVLLLDGSNNVITYAITDANGDYSFANLPLGTYKVHPELIGYTTAPATLGITNTKQSQSAINFERSTSQKTITPLPQSISNINAAELVFAVYPNPAKDVVTINWTSLNDNVAVVTITDISGKKILSTEASMNANAIININELQTGFYFINVATEFGSNTQKLIVQ